jgi:serine/threonine protein kinase
MEKLELEITIQRQFSHKNIVRIESFFEDNNNVYILLELCEYATLHELIKRREHFSEMETRYFCVQLIDALKLIHAKGIIHRDLKPGNVMLAKDM